MRYEMSARAWDFMDQVSIAVTVWEAPEVGLGGRAKVLGFTTTLAGVGESDPHEWLRDILVALLEGT